ncbi:4-carboxymuconolactone decarboxylase [Pelagibacterium xiamenense]|uniref:4-carboxymuconolactone decarboxylase n=1 Tax=Pelagibacterium xiamenense TaxID=2901140 RepID=UPI001E4A643B|nr:4-carboxymuconolactone decarboxylase [Pelagibacterium xiamenense]MCD7060673.1 4-carboxymuconolactone decarboxylase [Pelagibacterium xiamenense]
MSEQHDARARYEEGLATRRAVLGEDYVDRKQESATPFEAPFQTLITEAAWGHVWSRQTWSKRERSIVTIALLAALGHYEEMAMHVRATRRTGASETDLQEVMMHVAIYAGVPAANHAIGIIRDILAEDVGAGA